MSDKKNFKDGLLLKCIGGFYYIEAADMVYECKARGIFRKNGHSPCAGDRVRIEIPTDGYCTIEEIYPRKNNIVRPPLSNIDLLFIVCSTVSPVPNTLVIDKMTVSAIDNDIQPVIVISKSDLKDSKELYDIYSKSGIKTIAYSAQTKEGLSEIKSMLKDNVSAFIGNTGVGKSTLLNLLFPDLMLKTGEISNKLNRGKHTTRSVELFKTDGGYVADTPGFSTVDLERYQLADKDNLKYCFPEFKDYLTDCYFNSCNHICEKGCAILDAVEAGIISKSRHDSYVAMYNEVKDIKEWEKR